MLRAARVQLGHNVCENCARERVSRYVSSARSRTSKRRVGPPTRYWCWSESSWSTTLPQEVASSADQSTITCSECPRGQHNTHTDSRGNRHSSRPHVHDRDRN